MSHEDSRPGQIRRWSFFPKDHEDWVCRALLKGLVLHGDGLVEESMKPP